jgi:tRNA-dihydrouridine synthase B
MLAPMAGVTDIAFREICKSHGAALTCSEMVSANALVYQDAKSRTLLPRGAGEYPYAVQIFGHDPAIMVDAACKVLELVSPEFIDINMGCPTPKIVRNGDGAALMRDLPLAERIAAAVVGAVGSNAAVTVKMRAGWDQSDVNAAELARACEAAGVQAVAVHGRTRAQLYSGAAHRDVVRAVKLAVCIPVIVNGDITGIEHAERVMAETDADFAMIGRAAMGNPWAFDGAPPAIPERLSTAMAQVERSAELKGERTACLEARKYFAWYLKGVPGAVRLKLRVAKALSLSELRGIVAELA